jgi:hypothetical protein
MGYMLATWAEYWHILMGRRVIICCLLAPYLNTRWILGLDIEVGY